MPFRYAKVTRKGAPLFRRKPSFRELLQAEEAAAGRGKWPPVVQRRMDGIYILALDRPERVANRRLYRTVRGQFALAKDLAHKRPPRMRGERLNRGASTLPLAFVHGRGAKRFRLNRGTLRPAGTVRKQHRFRVERQLQRKGQRYLVAANGLAVRRRDTRLATQTRRPKNVPAKARWIHVDLSEQTLVAYEGARPVFATLVSSGKKGYATRPGLFRIQKKWLTTTMDATDPVEGFYRIEDVPWTMYYWRSFALHGAYWHDDFGTPRSHGCTNIAPRDARWLFHWSRPRLPKGWHARFSRRGTWVYITP